MVSEHGIMWLGVGNDGSEGAGNVGDAYFAGLEEILLMEASYKSYR